MLLRLLGIFLLLLLNVIEPAFAQAQFPFMGRVKSDRVYVRAGQNLNFETVAVVNKGETLVVLAKSYGWFQVKVPPQAKVFLKSEYAAMLTKDIGEIKADKVNARCAPNTNATILGKLERGRRFYVLGDEGDWLRIKPVDQLSAWVKEEFIEVARGIVVPARLYPDPIAPVPAPTPNPSWEQHVRKVSETQVEVAGVLQKDGQGEYQVVKDGVVVCKVAAPATVLDVFVGRAVTVQGSMTPASGNEPPVVKMSKVKQILE